MEITNTNIEFLSKENIMTIGNFDGLHLAHQKILKTIKQRAGLKKNSIKSLLTFENHPKTFFSNKNFKLLTSLDEKIGLLKKFDIDFIFIEKFDEKIANLSAADFIKKILIDKLNLSTLVIGDDHTLGKNKEGNYEFLKNISKKFNFEIIRIDPIFFERKRVSSTNIRKLIKSGNISQANKMLGYKYFVNSKVIEGKKIGRKIGFPTANIETPENKLLPPVGVYAVKTIINEKSYLGMCNIGYRPTINKSEKITLEVNIFDFNHDVYNKNIKLLFLDKIRDELNFASINDLIRQLHIDKQNVLNNYYNTKTFKNLVNI